MDHRIIDIIHQIIDIEESTRDYRRIDSLSREAMKIINDEELDISTDIYHYIDDFDTRMSDDIYAKDQIDRIKRYLKMIKKD